MPLLPAEVVLLCRELRISEGIGRHAGVLFSGLAGSEAPPGRPSEPTAALFRVL